MSTLAPERTVILAAVSHPEALAELVTIDGPDGPERFVLWPEQRGLIRTILSSPKVLILKARQLGVTWTLALIALWWALAHPAQTVLVVSIGEREAVDVLRRIRRLYESLPAIVREHFPLGQSTTTRLEIDHPEGAGVIVSLPSSSSAGRGQTVHLLIGDERPKWPHAEEQEASLLPAAADAGRVVLGGTANGMDGFFDRWSVGEWSNVFIGALAHPGRTEEQVMGWRAELGELGPQEYPLTADEAFLASGRCAFDRDGLSLMDRYSCRPAEWRGVLVRDAMGVSPVSLDDGNWWIWEAAEPGRDYFAIGDPCGGTATGDFGAIAVYDAGSWEQVAAYHGRPEPDAFAAELVKAGWLYNGGRPALLVPEANNHGQAVVALLRQWGYPRVYQSETFDQKTNRRTPRMGWVTDQKTRPQAISALQAAVRQGTMAIRDRAAITEMHRFVWRETPTGGRWEAGEGAHDDRVMTHAIAAAVLSLSAQGQVSDARPIVQPVIAPGNRTGYLAG